MIRTFTREQLEARSKTRPEGYVEDVLRVATETEPGLFVVETSDPLYAALQAKYSTTSPYIPPAKRHLSAAQPQESAKTRMLHSAAIGGDVVLEYGEALSAAFGSESFDTTLREVRQALSDKKGCSGCTKNAVRSRIQQAFAHAYVFATEEVREAVRTALGERGKALPIKPELQPLGPGLRPDLVANRKALLSAEPDKAVQQA